MKAIPWIIVGILLALSIILHYKSCGSYSTPTITDTVYMKDTIWQRYQTVVKKTVVVEKVIHDSIPVVFDAHPDYDSLKLQYQGLVKDYSSKKTYKDTFKLGALGSLQIEDTVQYNKLGIRTYQVEYIVPTVRESVVIKESAPKKAEWYYGGGLSFGQNGLNQLQTGVLYKSKRQHVSGMSLGINPDFKLSVGVSTYWKFDSKK